jgi:uncharacterized protein (DUF488 family)
MDPGRPAHIFTVGHSNHSSAHFEGLLSKHQIEVLVDVRSWPHSRYVQWADALSLPEVVRAVGVKYLFLGKELGGRPEAPDFYDADGHVLYVKVAETEIFQAGIARLRRGAERCRVAIMCSEENPTHCHRRLLVTKVLLDQGLVVSHIRGDGSCETEPGPINLCEGSLFDDEESLWRSSLSVSRGRPRKISSSA